MQEYFSWLSIDWCARGTSNSDAQIILCWSRKSAKVALDIIRQNKGISRVASNNGWRASNTVCKKDSKLFFKVLYSNFLTTNNTKRDQNNNKGFTFHEYIACLCVTQYKLFIFIVCLVSLEAYKINITSNQIKLFIVFPSAS